MARSATILLAALAFGAAGCAGDDPPSGPPDEPAAEAGPPAAETTTLEAPEGYRVEIAPTMWALVRVSRDGETVWIRTLEGGCKGFERAVVEDLGNAIRVTALARDLIPVEDGYACTADLRMPVHPVRLARALGDDDLLGACDPEPDTEAGGLCRMLRGIG